MGTLVSRIKKSTRWIIGIVLWVLFVFSGNLAFPLNRIFGLVLAIAFGAYVLACSIWKYNPDSHDEDEPPKITFKWSYLLIVMLTMVLITSAVGRMDSTAEKQATVKAEKKQTMIEPYLKEIEEKLALEFDIVQVTYNDNLSNGQGLILARVAADGMSQSLYMLKNAKEPDESEYRVFSDHLQTFVEQTVKEINSAEDVNLHFELQLLDDIAYRNFADFGADFPSTMLEIYDGELRYDRMTDTSPESFERTELMTLGKKQALDKADSYLDIMPFSQSGLVEQLEYEGFTHEEAVYGANNCGADWFIQAGLKAESYLDLMSFSRAGLIEQLEYEGFSHEEAVYGAEYVGY